MGRLLFLMVPCLFCMASVHEPASTDWLSYQNLTRAEVLEDSTCYSLTEHTPRGVKIEWADWAARTIRE